MKRFVDEQRDVHGVEPICKVLQIAPSTYYAHAARQADPELRSQRVKTDEILIPEVQRVWDDNYQVYGVRKVWRQLRREREERRLRGQQAHVGEEGGPHGRHRREPDLHATAVERPLEERAPQHLVEAPAQPVHPRHHHAPCSSCRERS